MISVEEARSRILASLAVVGTETIALASAYGRVLAAPIHARLTQPPANVSAMDGYAVIAADAQKAARLKIIGTAPAGHPYSGALGRGEAVRIFTGSFMPAGADSVLLQEDASAENGFVRVNETCPPGKHIRPAGQDFLEGDALLSVSRRLTARDIGLAAAGNHPWVTVYRRPRIAVLATGDEISLPGEPIGPGGIISSNAHALAAFITESGGDAIILPIAADDRDAIAAGADAARGADLLVTTGGASVGDHDLVQAGLESRGLQLDFWKIAMRPGKPLMFGSLGALPMLGLPGNPVSAFVCAWLFLGPAIKRLGGLSGESPLPEFGRLGAPMKPNDQRADYVRARLTRDEDGWIVTPFSVQDSGMLRMLALADAIIVRKPFEDALKTGQLVPFVRLER